MEVKQYNHAFETQVIALWEACGLVVPWNDPKKDIQRKMAVNPELFLVGVVRNNLEEDVVATAMGGYEGHRGWVNYLAVAPGTQRRGFGKQIMSALEKRLLNMGCPKINLQVRATNAAVIEFYESLGYQDDKVLSLGKRLIVDA